MDITTHDLNDKLETVVQMLNEETAVRGNADATLSGKLDALAKITAQDTDRLSSRLDATTSVVAGLMTDVASVKQANEIEARFQRIETTLTNIVHALNEAGEDAE